MGMVPPRSQLSSGTSCVQCPHARTEIIQEEVQFRRRELADNAKPGKSKIKSQRDGLADVNVITQIRWTLEYVLTRQGKMRVTYNQLTPVQ